MSNKENTFFSDNTFKLPIEYLNNKQKIPDNVKTDLELVNTVSENTKSIYTHTLQPTTELGKLSIPSWSKYFTTNKSFLEDSQKLYKNIHSIPFEQSIIDKMLSSWKDVKGQNNFLEKFQYIDFQRFMWLNRSSMFLSILSFYNISAPVLQLIAPIFILIVPFFVLKMMQLPISWDSYYKILKENLKNHAVGKLFFSFKKASLGNKAYLLFAAGMFFWNIYQNIISCYRFYINTYYITKKFEIINEYLDYTIEKMKFFYNLTNKYTSYNKFNDNLLTYKDKLQTFHNTIRNLPVNTHKLGKIRYIGKIMKHFFVLYDDNNIQNIIHYSFGFHGYIDSIIGINKNIRNQKINICTFNKKLKFKFNNFYHPSIENPIKNNINLRKNIIITGPNAAGKTTTIKATIINIILTQQIGYGFFDNANNSIFDYIHCYLNIPDTCSRDSLFQAEARRCKNILDIIEKHPNKKHFCIFDELYSGTNPYEAISSACSYLSHISKNKNVRFLLTTHYIRLCKLFDKKTISNKSMKTLFKKNNDPHYTYKITNGISTVKGGVSVLKNLNYPDNIINMTNKILDKM